MSETLRPPQNPAEALSGYDFAQHPDSNLIAATAVRDPYAQKTDIVPPGPDTTPDQTDPNNQALLTPDSPPEVFDTLENPPEFELPVYTDRETGEEKRYEPTGELNDQGRVSEDTVNDPEQFETNQLWIEPKPLRDLSLGTITESLLKAQDTVKETKHSLNKIENSLEGKAGRKKEEINALKEALEKAEKSVIRYEGARHVAAEKELDSGQHDWHYLGKTREIQLRTIKARALGKAKHEMGEKSAFQDFIEDREKKHPKGVVVKSAEAIGRLLLTKKPKSSAEPSSSSETPLSASQQMVEDLRQSAARNTPPGGIKNIGYALSPKPILRASSRIYEQKKGERLAGRVIKNKDLSPTQKAAYLNRFNELNKNPKTKAKEAHRLAKKDIVKSPKEKLDRLVEQAASTKVVRRPNLRKSAAKRTPNKRTAAAANRHVPPGGLRNIPYALNPRVIHQARARVKQRNKNLGHGRLDWLSAEKRRAEEASFIEKQEKLRNATDEINRTAS